MEKYTDILNYIQNINLASEDFFYNNCSNLINNNGNILKNKNCCIISHNGLGDNITMIGAVRYLTHFYNNVYVSVKNNNNYKNMKEIYKTNTHIILLSIDPTNEFEDIKNKINTFLINDDTDIFVSGSCHTSYIYNHITNFHFVNNIVKNENNIIFSHKHIINFYNDLKMNFKVYYTYFNIFDTEKSIQLYDDIKMYNIIFVHTESSTKKINIDLNDYINDDKFFIVCPNQNFYDKKHNKFLIAENYLKLLLIDYITIIKKADIIKVVDSSFSCIILPLQLKNELKTNNIDILAR